MKNFWFHICRSLIFIILLSTFALGLDSSNCTVVNLLQPGTTTTNPQMRFYLFTRNNPNFEQEIKTNNLSSITNSNYNNAAQTRIMVHGYKGNLTSCVNGYVKDAYLQNGNFNVIIIDWSDWGQDSNYFGISTDYYINYLGQLLANFIQFLNNIGTLSSNIYLIGHSMGAHLSGSAGRKLPIKIKTIFGLDPAKPNFEGQPNKILKCTDADYVEAIITSKFTFGFAQPIGCSTFYPNYGYSQPYCLENEPTNPVCNHVAGVRYFSESINSNDFCAAPCTYAMVTLQMCKNPVSSNYKMGGEPSVPKSGVFYLKTNADSLFSMGC